MTTFIIMESLRFLSDICSTSHRVFYFCVEFWELLIDECFRYNQLVGYLQESLGYHLAKYYHSVTC
jgi:hypothetical protein